MTLTLHTREIERLLALRVPEALHAAGETAAALVRSQMLGGYTQPVYETGALLRDVRFSVQGDRLRVGNTLPYAPFVHDGTARMPGRPYLADALTGGASALAESLAGHLSL